MNLHRLLAIALCALVAVSGLSQTPSVTDPTKGKPPGDKTSPSGQAGSTAKDLLGDLLPEGGLARMGSGRLRASTGITTLCFTPDFKFIVSASYSNKLQFWSVKTGKLDKEWTVGPYSVTGIHFSKDGKTMAIAGGDGTVRLLDGATGVERRQLVDAQRRYGNAMISLSPDGRWLIMNHRYDRQIVVFDTDNGVLKHRIANINQYNLPQIAWTPDSKHFVTLWTDNKLNLVEVAGGKSVRVLEAGATGAVSPYTTRITALALSADGKKLAYRTYSDRNFHIVNVADGKLEKTFERTTGYAYAQNGGMAMTPNGRFLIESGGDAAVRVWGIASGKMLRELSVPNSSINFMATSNDGKLVATATGNVIYLWDIASGKQMHGGSGHGTAVLKLAFSPDGKYLISAGSNSMRAWEATSGKELFTTRANIGGYGINYLTVEKDNKTVQWLGYDRAQYRWQFHTEKDPARLSTPRPTLPPLSLQMVSPDGKLLAGLYQSDRKVKLIDNIGNAPERELTILPNAYGNTFLFSPDGRTLAVASSDRSVTLYDVVSAMETRKLMPDPSVAHYHGNLLQFSSDGRTLLKYDGEMRIVETMSGSDRATLPRDPAGVPAKMKWSYDGRLVALGFGDGSVVVHDTWTGREVFRRATGQGSVTALSFSKDNSRLATGGTNTTAMVWDVPALPRASRIHTLSDDDAWSNLEDSNAGRAQRAMTHLIAAPEETVRLFKDRLKPRPPTDPKRVGQLIKDLDDDDFKVRESAHEELLEIGLLAEAALKKAARSTSAEMKRRAQDILRRLKPGSSMAPDRLRVQRAVEVLERIGTPAARAMLQGMLKSKLDGPLEVAIKSSLERLGVSS